MSSRHFAALAASFAFAATILAQAHGNWGWVAIGIVFTNMCIWLTALMGGSNA